MYELIQRGIGEECLNQRDLLQIVVNFKKKFYPCRWARYDEVLTGNCRIVCEDEAMNIFKKDYQLMKSMIYGEYPDFDIIIKCLKEYEYRLNKVFFVNII